MPGKGVKGVWKHMFGHSAAGFLAYKRLMLMTGHRPLDINIETISYCPLKCRFCCNRIYDREKTVMGNKMFEKIVRQYCEIWGGGTLGINSMQSEFFSDPMLLDRIRILKKYKEKLYVYADTPLIPCAKYADGELKEILEALDCMEISVEGHTEETYKAMSGVDGFGVFQRQLERVKNIIEQNHIGIKVRLLYRTYKKKELLKSPFYRYCNRKFETGDVKDQFFSWFGSIKQEDLPKGAVLVYSDDAEKTEGCVVPYATLSIESDGKVVGCGCVDWLKKYVVGDANVQDLDEIWRSRRAKAFRNALANGKRPSICNGCGLYTSARNAFSRGSLLAYNSHQGIYYMVE